MSGKSMYFFCIVNCEDYTLSQCGGSVHHTQGILDFFAILSKDGHSEAVGTFNKVNFLAKTTDIIWHYKIVIAFGCYGNISSWQSLTRNGKGRFIGDCIIGSNKL